MKKTIVFILICLFLSHSVVYALPFDEQKLLGLKPLLSARIDEKARQAKENKIWPALSLGLLGGAMIADSLKEKSTQIDENCRWARLMYGYTLLLAGISSFYTEEPYEWDQRVLNSVSQPGIEREKYAYFLFSKRAEDRRNFRSVASFIWTAAGLGFGLTPSLTPNASSDLKNSSLVMGVIFCGLGLYNYYFPSTEEQDLQKINAELKR